MYIYLHFTKKISINHVGKSSTPMGHGYQTKTSTLLDPPQRMFVSANGTSGRPPLRPSQHSSSLPGTSPRRPQTAAAFQGGKVGRFLCPVGPLKEPFYIYIYINPSYLLRIGQVLSKNSKISKGSATYPYTVYPGYPRVHPPNEMKSET